MLSTIAAGFLQFKHNVRDEEGVVQKGSLGRLILGHPINAAAWNGELRSQKVRALVSESIDDWVIGVLSIIVELGLRPVKKAVVIEKVQPAKDVLSAAVHGFDNLIRTQKPVFVDKPNNLNVAFSQLY